MTYPWVRERVEAGSLVLHGWWFDLDTGDLWITETGKTLFDGIAAELVWQRREPRPRGPIDSSRSLR